MTPLRLRIPAGAVTVLHGDLSEVGRRMRQRIARDLQGVWEEAAAPRERRLRVVPALEEDEA